MKRRQGVLLKKMCSFYVSDWHLITMLLPYITKKLNNKLKIETILEKPLVQDIKTVIPKTNLEKKLKDEIINLDWKCKNLIKYTIFEEYINNIIKKQEEIYLIIKGENSYLEIINNNLEKWLSKNANKYDVKLNIINTFEVTEFNRNFNEILNNHDKILNTSGEREIEEVFEGYKKAN